MKPREKILLAATVLVCLVVLYAFFPADLFEGATAASGDSASLSAAQKTFQDNFTALQDPDQIRAKYQAIAFNLPEQEAGKDPGGTFQNQLFKLLVDRLGVKNPRVSSPTLSRIPSVDDYYFVDIEVQTSGTHAELMKLMQDMESLGLLIKSFKFQQGSGYGIQRDQINLTVKVARLVKHDAASHKLMDRMGKRGK